MDRLSWNEMVLKYTVYFKPKLDEGGVQTLQTLALRAVAKTLSFTATPCMTAQAVAYWLPLGAYLRFKTELATDFPIIEEFSHCVYDLTRMKQVAKQEAEDILEYTTSCWCSSYQVSSVQFLIWMVKYGVNLKKLTLKVCSSDDLEHDVQRIRPVDIFPAWPTSNMTGVQIKMTSSMRDKSKAFEILEFMPMLEDIELEMDPEHTNTGILDLICCEEILEIINAKRPGLKCLNLKCMDFTAAVLSKWSKLTKLDISRCVNDFDDMILDRLKYLTNLTTIYISAPNQFAKLPPLSTIKELVIKVRCLQDIAEMKSTHLISVKPNTLFGSFSKFTNNSTGGRRRFSTYSASLVTIKKIKCTCSLWQFLNLW